MEQAQFFNIVILMGLFNMIDLVVSECAEGQDSHNCDGKEICYGFTCSRPRLGGGTSNITARDVLCMVSKSCDITYRDDTCEECDKNPSQYDYGSQYKDCSGKCYKTDEMSSMKKVDKCGVCDGTNSTCSPKVTGLDIELLPDTANITIDITGSALITPNVQILLLTRVVAREKREAQDIIEFSETAVDELVDSEAFSDRKRVKRNVKTVERVLDIVKVYGATKLEIRIHSTSAGDYEIGARTGDDGEEYLDNTGPVLTVYAESDYTIDSISPTEQDLDGTDKVTATLQLETTSQDLSIESIYDIAQQFKCFYSSSMAASLASDTISSNDCTFNRSETTLELDIPIPEMSKAIWVCPSFNNIHLIGCKRITFYVIAPVPVDDTLYFTEAGDGLYVDFVTPVVVSNRASCTKYFTDVSTLGTNPRCYFNDEGVRLSIIFRDGNTASPGDTLELKAGLMPRDGEFRRQSQAVNLTLAISPDSENVTDHIKIATLGSWPEILTSSAESPVTLEIQIINLPSGRPPESIIWMVNDIEQGSADGQFKLDLDVTQTGEYRVTVTATDFLGGESVIRHTIDKTDADMPSVRFTLTGVRESYGGRFIIHPNTVLTISTTVQYPRDGSSANDYNFQWKRNGIDVDGQFIYESSKGETTIEMCGDTVVYSLVVSRNGKSIEYSITLRVECRDPVARISGNDMLNVDISHDDVTLFGSLSYDPDGGTVSYQWTCSTLGDTACIDKVTSTRSASTTSSTVTISPSRMKAGKKYAIFLTVSVEKAGVEYTSTDKVIFAAQAGDKPVIRWVTIRTKFRHDVPIMMKAFVGTDVIVEWSIRDDLALYDSANANDITVGKRSRVTEGFAWYTIRPGALSPGSQYKMQLNVTAKKSGLYSIDEHDVYIYELLRGCTVDVSTITELEESSISLRSCAQDPDVEWRSITCTAGDRELHLSPTLSFIVPFFKPGVTNVVLRCKIMDSLGNSMLVNSSEVTIVKAAQDKTVAQKAESLEETGNLLDALALLSEMAEDEVDEGDQSLNTKAVGLIKKIVSGDPTDNDIHRSLNNFGRLKVDKVQTTEKEGLANNLVTMLDKLCRADQQSEAVAFNVDQIKNMLQNTKRLMESTEKLGKLYRAADDKLACIKFKLMQDGDFEAIELEDGSKHKYFVSDFDDTENFDLGIEIPEDLRSKYRDQWSCGNLLKCNSVALKVGEYVSEPPNLPFGRADKNCGQYVIVDLYNPFSGQRISVKNLDGTVNMNLGTKCPRGQCWYYDTFLERYSQDGVTTTTDKNGSTICQTHHLTAFTVRSEPELYQGMNYPYVISICVGCVLVVISAAVLLKLFLVTKKRASAVDEKPLDLDEVPAFRKTSTF